MLKHYFVQSHSGSKGAIRQCCLKKTKVKNFCAHQSAGTSGSTVVCACLDFLDFRSSKKINGLSLTVIHRLLKGCYLPPFLSSLFFYSMPVGLYSTPQDLISVSIDPCHSTNHCAVKRMSKLQPRKKHTLREGEPACAEQVDEEPYPKLIK